MKKPNFLCIGAQKAGTTLLYDILVQHPDVYLAENKEAHFFSKKAHYSKGMKWWMDTFFNGYDGEKILGALTPEYLYYSEIPAMIHRDLGPDIKLIVILRHPVDRAYSHYLMEKRRGNDLLDFHAAIDAEHDRILQGEKEREMYSYMTRGNYAEQIERYQQLYDEKQLLILSYEKDIRDNLKQTVARILSFLEIEQRELNLNFMSNRAKETRSVALQQFTRESALKQLLKRILPAKFRRNLRKSVDAINSRDLADDKKRLSDKERSILFDRSFSKEPEKLLEQTGIDFSYWQIAAKQDNQ